MNDISCGMLRTPGALRSLAFAVVVTAGAALALPVTSAVILATEGAAYAADATIEPDLAAAEAAYGQLNYEDAARRAELVTKKRGLSHDQLVRSYRVLAFSRAAIGDDEHARESFVLLLTYDPDHKVDKSLGPKVQQPYLEAKGYWRQQMARPGIEVSPGALRQGTTATLRVVTRDPSHVAKGVTVGYRFGAQGRFETAQIAVGEQSVNLSVPTGETRLDYYVQALDANESVVFEVGNPSSPKTSLVEVKSLAPAGSAGAKQESGGSVFSSPIFWVATGVVLVGGAVGTYFIASSSKGTREEQTPPTGANLAPILFCGTEKCR